MMNRPVSSYDIMCSFTEDGFLRRSHIRETKQASLLGSVFSNMLLVLGCCFFFGGLKHKEQHFNSTSAVANMSLLLLSSLALVLPTPLSHAAVSERRVYSSTASELLLYDSLF